MGICNLLRFLKPFTHPIHISKYGGKRVGIDAYSWLHKGAYSCSMEICLNSDKQFQYLQYFMHRLHMLRHFKITPVVVFDGANIPCKASTDHHRRSRRKSNLDLAMTKLKEGDSVAAFELFRKAVSITPTMAYQLIRILRSENIEFVVAPYEADAQLAYLFNLEEDKGGISAVITEDSDLLAYGCNNVIFKMDRGGNGEEILLDKIFNSVDQKPSFRNFDQDLFIGMCVLAGCDFLPSVPGIGIARSHSLVSKYRNLDRVLSVLKCDKSKQMPEDYLKSFKESMAVFQHARIYDVNTKSIEFMKPPQAKLLQSLDGELDFLGPEMPSSIAIAVAQGKLDPITMEAFSHIPLSTGYHMDPVVVQVSDRVERHDSSPVSTQESCFTVQISNKKAEERSRVKEEKTDFDRRKYMNEAAALFDIGTQVQEHNTVGTVSTLDDEPSLKVPDNNPFRKRKCSQVFMDPINFNTEEMSVLTQVEESGFLTFPSFDSPESVTSKPLKSVAIKQTRASVKKLKKSNCKNFETKKNSILNFFSRVYFFVFINLHILVFLYF